MGVERTARAPGRGPARRPDAATLHRLTEYDGVETLEAHDVRQRFRPHAHDGDVLGLIACGVDVLVSRRLPPSGVLLGAALCCLGAAVLGGGLSGLNGGDGLVFCAAAPRACMVIATQRLMAGRALSSAALTAVQAGTVAVLTGAALASTSGHPGLPVGLPFWAAVLFLSLLCTVGALYVQNASVRRTSPTRVAFLFGTEPVFGFVFAVLLLGEPVSSRGLIGGALILAGTAVGLAAPA